MQPWWGTRSNVSKRLNSEVLAMRAKFEETFKLTVPNISELYWQGTVELNLTKLTQRNHTLKLVYPNNFPVAAPNVYVIEPRIWSPEYQFADGRLSLFNPLDGVKYGWNPATTTAATVASWAIHWLYAYHTWQFTGDWPKEFKGTE